VTSWLRREVRVACPTKSSSPDSAILSLRVGMSPNDFVLETFVACCNAWVGARVSAGKPSGVLVDSMSTGTGLDSVVEIGAFVELPCTLPGSKFASAALDLLLGNGVVGEDGGGMVLVWVGFFED
jgi:hypothetical protein